jgi:uncharacterized membrane protein YoaK (UPF0700 family)
MRALRDLLAFVHSHGLVAVLAPELPTFARRFACVCRHHRLVDLDVVSENPKQSRGQLHGCGAQLRVELAALRWASCCTAWNALPKRTRTRVEIAVAAGLALSAGFVDALGALLLGGILVAHMSGNTAVGALSLERGEWSKALVRLAPIPWFLAGAGCGRILSVRLGRQRRRRFSVLLGVEVLALVGFLLLSWSRPGPHAPSVALLAVAMGLQSAALRHAAGHDVRTTFVTGMLIAIIDELIDWLFARGSDAAGPGFHGLIWGMFFVGAFAGAAAEPRFGARAALLPILLVSMIAVVTPASTDAPTG